LLTQLGLFQFLLEMLDFTKYLSLTLLDKSLDLVLAMEIVPPLDKV